MSHAPMNPRQVRSRSFTTTPRRETRPISRSSATASSGEQWWTTIEAWATSNERSG